MIRSSGVFLTRRSVLLLGIIAGGLGLVGCGVGDSGKQFSQDFPKPEGAAATGAGTTEDFNPAKSKKKEIEESRQELLNKSKGRSKQRRQ